MKKIFALCFAVLLLPIAVSGQGERYNLSLGRTRTPMYYSPLDTNGLNYTIVRGDNLWNLAIQYYGEGQQWRYIWEHNTYIKDPHWIYPGNPLFIPGMRQTNTQQTNNTQTAQTQTNTVRTDTMQTLPLEFSDIFGDTVKTAAVKIDSVETKDSVTAQDIDTITAITEVTPKVKSGKKRYFVLSLRGEALSPYDISGVGGSMELGAISGNGFYFSLDLSGGKPYYGGGFDMGGCIGKDKAVKSVIGIFGGYWTFMNSMEVIKNGKIIADDEGKNMSYGGGFWKLMFGRTFNIDITNKCFVVLKDEPTGWDNEKGKLTYEKGIKPMWSGSAGFTFTVKKKRPGR